MRRGAAMINVESTRRWEREQFEEALIGAEGTSGASFLLYMHGISGIGKTTLLDRFERIAQDRKMKWLTVNGKDSMFAEEIFLKGLLRSVGCPALDESGSVRDAYRTAASAVNEQAKSVPIVIAIDHYEYIMPYDSAFRECFINRLDSSVQVVVASTQVMPALWMTDMQPRRRIKVIELQPFAYEEAMLLLSESGLDLPTKEAIWEITQGHALSIALAVSWIRSNAAMSLERVRENIHQEMARHWYRGIASDALRDLVTAASLLFQFNQEILEAVLQTQISAEQFHELTSFSFVRLTPKGWYVHDLVREAVRSDFHRRLPNMYNEYMKRCAFYYYHVLKNAFKRRKEELVEDFYHFYYYTGDEELRELYFRGKVHSGNYYEPMMPEAYAEVQEYIRQRKRTVTVPHALIALNGMTVDQHQRLTSKEFDVIQPEEFLELGENSVRLLRNERKELIGLSVVIPMDRYPRHAAALPVVGAYIRAQGYRPGDAGTGTAWFLRMMDCIMPMTDETSRTDLLKNFLSYLGPNRLLVTSTAFPGLSKVYENLGFKKIPGLTHAEFGDEFQAQFYALDLRGESFYAFLDNKMRGAGYSLPAASRLPLTKREQEISDLILSCKTNEAIAGELFISIVTVKKHIGSIFSKAGVKNRAQYIRLITGMQE